MSEARCDVLIVGGGPAGMMAGFLFARAGLKTTVLEKHGDFLRDFRGDTVHPSTLDLFHQLGMLDELLAIKHSRIEAMGIRIAGRVMQVADFSKLPVAAPFIAMMPQWDLLNFIADKASHYPGFDLRMSTEAVDLTFDGDGRVSGVKTKDGSLVCANLVIAADGRRSVLRGRAALPLENLGAPMDVFWFRVNKPDGFDEDTFAVLEAGQFLILIDRGDYFQCAYVLRKGQADAVKGRGLDPFVGGLAALVPELADSFGQLTAWDEIKTLEVSLDRLESWHRLGLLVIGDAAHAMSPVGGVGINIAIQDAVCAANILAGPMVQGENIDLLLRRIYDKRIGPVKRMQAIQKTAHDRVIAPLLGAAEATQSLPVPSAHTQPYCWLGLWAGEDHLTRSVMAI